MKLDEITLLELLANQSLTFFIPPYQRNYEWHEEMCEMFYKDIEKIANNNNLGHFFGTFICYEKNNDSFGTYREYMLVDGQQRLTTTMLFLIAVRDCSTSQNLKNKINSFYLKNDRAREGDAEYKIKLKQVEKDWKVYKNIILELKLNDADKKSDIYKNYEFFKSKLGKLNSNEIENLIEGLARFKIIIIKLEPQIHHWEKPQEIFESMNSLGKPLSLADLVRNYLLLGKDYKEQKKLYDDYWLKIEENLSGDDNDFSISAFIRDYMQLDDEASYKKATEVNYKELYRNFKDLFDSYEHEELIKTLAEYSGQYAILAGYKLSGNNKIDLKIADIKEVKASAFYSFILGVLHLRSEKKLDDNDTLLILDAIFIYVARRRIMSLTQGENKDIPLLVKDFDDIILSQDKKAKVLELLSNQQLALRLPNNNEIRDRLLIAKSNFYNLERGKFLLSLIEEYLTKNRPILDKALEVEHIMPQTLTKNWKDNLGQNYQSIHDDYLHNIGNLTLIRHNSELGNQDFAYKKEIYENKSGMQITKNKILDKKSWGEEEIKDRAEYLVNILTENVLPVSDKLKTGNNYSSKEKQKNKLSFKKLELIGKTITYFDDININAKIVNDKLVKFENKTWRLSPLTREIETRKNRRNLSGAYWGVDKWRYEGKTLQKLMLEIKDCEDECYENES